MKILLFLTFTITSIFANFDYTPYLVCKEHPDAHRANPQLSITLRNFEHASGLKVTCVHRGICRGKDGDSKTSQHYDCNAIDFYLGAYTGDRPQDLQQYMERFDRLVFYLEEQGLLDLVGIGLYPDRNTIHLDFRGHRARWAFIGNEQISVQTVWDLFYLAIENYSE